MIESMDINIKTIKIKKKKKKNTNVNCEAVNTYFLCYIKPNNGLARLATYEKFFPNMAAILSSYCQRHHISIDSQQTSQFFK